MPLPHITRFCNFCGNAIEDTRRAWKSPFCSAKCRRDANNQKRDLRGFQRCKLCGRTRPKPKAPDAVATVATHNPVTAQTGESAAR